MPQLESLLAQLTSGDDQQAEDSVRYLIKLGIPALEALLKLSADENPDHRWWAVRTLSEFDHPVAVEGLSKALCDPDPSVRQCAALGLRQHPSPNTISALIQSLESEDRLLSRLAGDALAVIGTPAIPDLSRCLESTNPTLRGEAARTLALMESPETIPILFSAVEDPSTIVQYWIEEGFDRLGIGMVFFRPG